MVDPFMADNMQGLLVEPVATVTHVRKRRTAIIDHITLGDGFSAAIGKLDRSVLPIKFSTIG